MDSIASSTHHRGKTHQACHLPLTGVKDLQLDTVLSCSQKVIATPNVGFRRIELQVFDAGERQVARLVGFATVVR
ncbi:MAG: hypothetical protein EBY76_08020 [Betaproteobacteria bacterium]|nr:hypothetical protein [Betaproteobacteria bacterium]